MSFVLALASMHALRTPRISERPLTDRSSRLALLRPLGGPRFLSFVSDCERARSRLPWAELLLRLIREDVLAWRPGDELQAICLRARRMKAEDQVQVFGLPLVQNPGVELPDHLCGPKAVSR